MRRTFFLCLFAVPIAFASIATPTALLAQSIWTHYKPQPSVTVELLKPNFDESSFESLTFAGYVSARSPLGRHAPHRAFLAVEIPFAQASWESSFPGEDTSEAGPGNVYIGIEAHGRTGFLEAGVRLPTSDEKNSISNSVGVWADVERIGAFFSDLWTAEIMFNYTPENAEGVGGRIRGGSTLLFSTESGAENEILLHLGGLFVYDGEYALMKGGLSGMTLLSGDEPPLDETSRALLLGISIAGKIGAFQPALEIRVPVNGDLLLISDLVTNVFGLSLSVVLD